MDFVWSDYDTFDSRAVRIKAPSIYIIMTRIYRITGLEWAKMYEKLHSVLIWSLKKDTYRRCRKPHRSNFKQSIVYSL